MALTSHDRPPARPALPVGSEGPDGARCEADAALVARETDGSGHVTADRCRRPRTGRHPAREAQGRSVGRARCCRGGSVGELEGGRSAVFPMDDVRGQATTGGYQFERTPTTGGRPCASRQPARARHRAGKDSAHRRGRGGSGRLVQGHSDRRCQGASSATVRRRMDRVRMGTSSRSTTSSRPPPLAKYFLRFSFASPSRQAVDGARWSPAVTATTLEMRPHPASDNRSSKRSRAVALVPPWSAMNCRARGFCLSGSLAIGVTETPASRTVQCVSIPSSEDRAISTPLIGDSLIANRVGCSNDRLRGQNVGDGRHDLNISLEPSSRSNRRVSLEVRGSRACGRGH